MITTVEVLGVAVGLLGGSGVTSVITFILNRNKNKAETESVVVKMYNSLAQDMREELKRMRDEIDALRKKEILYLEQSNMLMKDKDLMRERVRKLEEINNSLKEERKQLHEEIAELKTLFNKK